MSLGHFCADGLQPTEIIQLLFIENKLGHHDIRQLNYLYGLSDFIVKTGNST